MKSKKKGTKKVVKSLRGRVIDTSKVTRGNFIPVEASYVPPFRMSAHFMYQNQTDWKLVHGLIHVVPNEWKILSKVQSTPHAWVETMEFVYDPQFEIRMPKNEYYKLFKVKKPKKYTFEGMKAMLRKKRRYGRWDEVLCFEQS